MIANLLGTIAISNQVLVRGTNLTSGFNGSSPPPSVNTASVSPLSNSLLLLAVMLRRGDSVQPVQPTITGNGLTWVLVNSVYYDSVPPSMKTLFVFRAMGASPSTGSVTINIGAGNGVTDVIWTLDEFTNVNTSGTNGSGAIVQSVVNSDNSDTISTLTATLSAFSNIRNATYGAITISNLSTGVTSMAAGTGFTKLSDVDDNVTNNSIGSEFRSDNDTTVDVTAKNAGVTANSDIAIIAIEIAVQ